MLRCEQFVPGRRGFFRIRGASSGLHANRTPSLEVRWLRVVLRRYALSARLYGSSAHGCHLQ